MTTRIGSWTTALMGAVLVAVLQGCGGSGGDGVVPPPPVVSEPVLTVGAITGFGSVHVNGVRYETDDADIIVDGVVATQSALKVGQVIELKGEMRSGSAYADIIHYHNNLEGPVTEVDLPGLRFVAMGQTVLVGPETSFGDGVSPPALEGISVGDIVEVSGLVNAAGEIEATRVDIKPDGGLYDVYGYVAGHVPAEFRFMINALVVDYSGANLDDFEDGAPADGDLVLVKGAEFGEDGEFIATRIELRHDEALTPADGSLVHVAGFITRFVSPTDFDVAGWPVTTTDATVYEGGTVADLELGAKVCVRGLVGDDGVLVASRITFKVASDVRVIAQVSDIDVQGGLITAMGIEISALDDTRFEDESEADLPTFGLGDLNPGDWVDVRGYESPAGSGAVVASRIERLDAQDEDRLRGPFRDPAQPAFKVLAVQVYATDQTNYVIEGGQKITAAEFFGLAEETLVEIRGSWDGTALTATHAIIKTCED